MYRVTKKNESIRFFYIHKNEIIVCWQSFAFLAPLRSGTALQTNGEKIYTIQRTEGQACSSSPSLITLVISFAEKDTLLPTEKSLLFLPLTKKTSLPHLALRKSLPLQFIPPYIHIWRSTHHWTLQSIKLLPNSIFSLPVFPCSFHPCIKVRTAFLKFSPSFSSYLTPFSINLSSSLHPAASLILLSGCCPNQGYVRLHVPHMSPGFHVCKQYSFLYFLLQA